MQCDELCEALNSAVVALRNKRHLAAVACPGCNAMLLNKRGDASVPHTVFECHECGEMSYVVDPVVANQLAVAKPILNVEGTRVNLKMPPDNWEDEIIWATPVEIEVPEVDIYDKKDGDDDQGDDH